MVVLADISPVALTVVIVIAIAAAALVTLFLKRRRQNTWQRFARRSRLKYQENDEGIPRVDGIRGGRPVKLTTSNESSDTGALGIEVIKLSVELLHPLPASLKLESATGIIGDMQRAMDEKRVDTGDEQFDRLLHVHSQDPQAALAWLTPKRRQALMQLVSADPQADIRLVDGELFWRSRERLSEVKTLESHLEALVEAAEKIDASD